MLEVALAWFLDHAPSVLGSCATFLGGLLLKHVVPMLVDRATKRWLKAVKELEAMGERTEEELAAAEAFKLEAAAAKDARILELEADVDRMARQLAVTHREKLLMEVLARELDGKLTAIDSGHTPILRPPRSEPPDVTEVDDRKTLPPMRATPPPLPPLPAPWGPPGKKP